MAKRKNILERLSDAEKIADKAEKDYRQETGKDEGIKEKSVMVRLGESYHSKLKKIVAKAHLRDEKATLQGVLEDLVNERYREEFGE